MMKRQEQTVDLPKNSYSKSNLTGKNISLQIERLFEKKKQNHTV